MAEMGWPALTVPEAHGGLGLGIFELCLVLEAAGRRLATEPFLSTVLLATEAFKSAGGALAAQWLPRIASGQAIASVAWLDKGARHKRSQVRTGASETAGGNCFTLNGVKTQVPDGHIADVIIVPARTRGAENDTDGITLFALDPRTPGLHIERQWRIDGHGAAVLTLEDVQAPEATILGRLHGGWPALSHALEVSTVGLCAESLGGANAAFETTVEYLKTRHQFGVPIGSFQALQHRAARLFMELALARSALLTAARTADEDPSQLPAMASLAKARIDGTYLHVVAEGVQMHGGVGVTDEYDIGLFLKRARATSVTFGDAAWHTQRWASLAGY